MASSSNVSAAAAATTTTTASSSSSSSYKKNERLHFVVIVMGDVGRSPRMQYHAASLLQQGHDVTLVGYSGAALIPALVENKEKNKQLTVVRFQIPTPKMLHKFLPLYLVWRITSMILYLFHALWFRLPTVPHVILVQNPPAMPLLAVVYAYSLLQKFIMGNQQPAMVIDWHNLGYTMLLGKHVIFSKVAKMYERFFGPLATAHLCVTKALKSYLHRDFHIPLEKTITVVYDCPPQALFQPLTVQQQHEFLSMQPSPQIPSIHSKLCHVCPVEWYQNLDSSKQTLLTEKVGNNNDQYRARPGRPALVMSSTSWTPDEDFGILLQALVVLNEKIILEKQQTSSSLKVMVVVTGKGPQKAMYQQRISQLQLSQVAIQTLWLEPCDYPKLIACADVGISLHTSTSGLDLPMKILDMFGCHVPVVAKDFACLDELVKEDENGQTFDTSQELADWLWYLLQALGGRNNNKKKNSQEESLPVHGFGELERYSENLKHRSSWEDNWKQTAYPTLLQAAQYYSSKPSSASSSSVRNEDKQKKT